MATRSNLSDPQLLQLARKVVFKKFLRSLPGDMTHEDAVGEAFILAKRAKARYDAEAPDTDETLWIWVRTVGDLRDKFEILRRQAKAFAKGDQRGTTRAQPVDPFNVVSSREDLAAALSKLTPEQREVVEAIYLRGETQEEVAERRGCSQPAVSQMVARAFLILRAELGEDYLDE